MRGPDTWFKVVLKTLVWQWDFFLLNSSVLKSLRAYIYSNSFSYNKLNWRLKELGAFCSPLIPQGIFLSKEQ